MNQFLPPNKNIKRKKRQKKDLEKLNLKIYKLKRKLREISMRKRLLIFHPDFLKKAL